MIAEALIAGPSNIYVRRDSSDYERLSDFDQILHITLRMVSTVSAWSVYRERQNSPSARVPGCVLRHVVWDKEIKTASSNAAEGIPGLSITTEYVTGPPCARITRVCRGLDNILLKGVPFTQRSTEDTPDWYQLSIYRSLDIEIRLSWLPYMENKECEKAIFKVARIIEDILKARESQEQDKIEAMEFVYSSNLPPGFPTSEQA
ncbi:MAG: hypothetical protein QOH93_958 [Chloroflexia bacterium]|jgi:hypothetical protein|nr:hypothetical protein [Chloroflexia bacterium]